jgi:MAP/microtubule affinity-regulating kinase
MHHIYLVMEYIRGCSLHSYLKSKYNRKIEEEEARGIFKQVVSGVAYCHRKSVSHRDIKLENVLMTEDGVIKIIDFGFSTCIPNDKKIKLFCGTPSYMAPEIVSKKEFAGPPADVWALGVLLYAILCGVFPFKGIDDKDLYRKIMRGTFGFPDHLSAQARNLLIRMLTVEPDCRPTATDILCDQWVIGQKEFSWKLK